MKGFKLFFAYTAWGVKMIYLPLGQIIRIYERPELIWLLAAVLAHLNTVSSLCYTIIYWPFKLLILLKSNEIFCDPTFNLWKINVTVWGQFGTFIFRFTSEKYFHFTTPTHIL